MNSSFTQHECGLVHFSRNIFEDERGSFSELYREEYFLLSENKKFCQDNLSSSRKGVLRGLHMQQAPHEQAKLITCLKGEAFDVAIDLRFDSPTFLKYWVFLLNSEKGDTLFIPEGFAHGFCALSDEVFLFYKTTNYYNPSSELILRWDDPDLGIPWPSCAKNISEKDENGISLREFLGKGRENF